jgi:hypothetical protein
MARFLMSVGGQFLPQFSLRRSVKLVFLTNIYLLAIKFGLLKNLVVGG